MTIARRLRLSRTGHRKRNIMHYESQIEYDQVSKKQKTTEDEGDFLKF